MFLPESRSAEFLTALIQWLSIHYIEVLATITGLVYVVFSIRVNILLWPFGLISSALYVLVFYNSRIFALMCINLYYVLISIYGWYHWTNPGLDTDGKLPVLRLKKQTGIILFIVSSMLFFLIAYILERFTDSDVVYWDAFITAFSITATWMLARKIKEHWLVWIVVDLVAVILYIKKGLFPSVLLFSCYTVLAFTGFSEWSKLFKKQEE